MNHSNYSDDKFSRNSSKEKKLLVELVFKPLSVDVDRSDSSLLRPDDGENTRNSPDYLLVCFAIIANFIAFSAGSGFTWCSPTNPKLRSNDTLINPLPKPINTVQDSLLASLFLMGALIGTLAAGVSSENFGKKKTLLIFGLPMVMCHVIIAFVYNIYAYIVARVMLGIGTGCVYSVMPTYISEIAKDSNRGVLGCFMGISVAFGQLFSYLVGPFVDIQMFSFINLIPLVLFYVFFGFFISESPYDMVKRDDLKAAEGILMRIRRKSSAAVQKELETISETVKGNSDQKASVSDFFRNKVLLRGLMISCVSMVFQQFSGICTIFAYMETIFEVSGVSLDAKYAAMVTAAIGSTANFLSSQIIDRLGRKKSIIYSSIAASLSLLGLGAYYFLRTKGFDVSTISWIPLACLIWYQVFFNLGCANAPWVMIGELFPSNYKAVASAISTFVCFTCASLSAFGFPILNEALGEAWSFWFFGGMMAAGAVFTAFVVPETMGKSFLEIQTMLKRK